MKKTPKFWKTIYILLNVFLIVLGVSAIIFSLPKLDVYDSRCQLKCDNGYLFGDFSCGLMIKRQEFDGLVGDQARFLCLKPGLSVNELKEAFEAERKNIPEQKNYAVVFLEKKYIGDWNDAIYVFVTVLILLPVFSLLGRTILSRIRKQ